MLDEDDLLFTMFWLCGKGFFRLLSSMEREGAGRDLVGYD